MNTTAAENTRMTRAAKAALEASKAGLETTQVSGTKAEAGPRPNATRKRKAHFADEVPASAGAKAAAKAAEARAPPVMKRRAASRLAAYVPRSPTLAPTAEQCTASDALAAQLEAADDEDFRPRSPNCGARSPSVSPARSPRTPSVSPLEEPEVLEARKAFLDDRKDQEFNEGGRGFQVEGRLMAARAACRARKLLEAQAAEEAQEAREAHETQAAHETREAHEAHENRVCREMYEAFLEARKAHVAREAQEARMAREAQEARVAREAQEARVAHEASMKAYATESDSDS